MINFDLVSNRHHLQLGTLISFSLEPKSAQNSQPHDCRQRTPTILPTSQQRLRIYPQQHVLYQTSKALTDSILEFTNLWLQDLRDPVRLNRIPDLKKLFLKREQLKSSRLVSLSITSLRKIQIILKLPTIIEVVQSH